MRPAASSCSSVDVELEGRHRPSRSHSRATSGCSSPIQPSLRSSRASTTDAWRPGMQERAAPPGSRQAPPRRHPRCRPPRAAPRAGPSRAKKSASRAGVRQPAGVASVSSAPRWWRSARASRRRASRRAPAPSGAGRPVHVRRLEQRDLRAPVRGVVARRVEQARQQQRPHHAQVLAQRVLEPQRLDVRRAAAAPSVSRRGEAVRDRLEQAAVAQHVLEPPAQRLAAASAARRLAVARAAWSAACRGRGSRATSSIRSASRCTSASRQGGTATSHFVAGPPRHARSRAARGSPRPRPRDALARAASRSAPARSGTDARLGAGCGYASIVPGTSRAPHSSTISRAASRCAAIASSGCSCFSKRARRLGAQPERLRASAGCSGRPRWPPPSARAWSCRTPPRSGRP